MSIKTYVLENRKTIFTQIGITVLIFIILALAGFVYVQRNLDRILGYAVNKYVEKQYNTGSQDEDIETESDVVEVKPEAVQNIFSEESRIVDLIEKANPAVVSIVVSKNVPIIEKYNTNPFGDLWGNDFFSIPQYRQNGTELKEIGAGSGFIVSKEGLVVTNRHVVDDVNASYTLYTNDGKSYDVDVVARDTYLDLAVLKIKGEKTFPFLTFADSDSLKLGQNVVAIGNALGEFRNSVSVGVVSGLSRSITAGDGKGNSEVLEMVIQTDAAINHGNSGGPLLDINGKVIGVNVAVAEGSENIGFALPGNAIKSAVESVKLTGEIARPYLGVRFLPIDKEMQEKNNIPVDYGVIVTKGKTATELAVIPGSPADKAGIVENDIIIEIDGVRIDENKSLTSVIQTKKVGQKVSIKIMRKGSYMTLNAVLEKSEKN